eukprot:CCRYP_007810-RA/>CCRYP_007810-RA protein AED:0.30 eAED:0.30 QI:292/0.83/0.85/1/0.83/0.85/7/1028/486
MRYRSTRGDGSEDYSFEQALFSGYAPDGGLFVPASLPQLAAVEHLIPWSRLTFPELCYEILRLFISQNEISNIDLREICYKSLSAEDFDDDNIVPIKKMGSVFVAELFHGPTFCFKDLGMRPVINLLSHFAKIRNQATTLLVATTGDTGPAAVRAVGDASNPLLTILVHYPHGQISEFQRKSLTTVDSKCVRIVSFEGGGDDMDSPIKQTLLNCNDSDGADKKRSFCGVNSYNIGRPLVQMVHFIDVVLPTGAMGNMTGGYMAKQMGIPIGRLCAGVNINDITKRVIETGLFQKKKIQKTLSDAINIEVPYNFERILFYLTNGNASLVKQWMETMEQTQMLRLNPSWHHKLQADFQSARITDDETCRALRQTLETYHYVVDPHTAVAIAAADRLGYSVFDERSENENPVVVLATASPCKFQEAVTAALGPDGWKQYRQTSFPSRAQQTLEMRENEPHHFCWIEGATLSEVQSDWRKKMLDIVDKHF